MPTKRTGVYRHHELTRLLHPASVAVVGASTRAGSFGERVLANQQNYHGRVYAVNARYDKIGDLRCYPSVGALPEVPDCAVITTSRDAVEEVVLDCAKAGVGGVIIFASGYAEMVREDRVAAQDRLAAIARETNLRIVGPNCIGIVNAALDARLVFMNITPIPAPRPRSVGIISQSGALGMALAQAVVRGASFSHVFTSGNSCDVDMADYVAYLAEDPSCASIACVFEGMAQPERMLRAAEIAWQHDKPLVVFKMATGEEGAAAAMSHTGSLAGSQAAYRAVFEKAGAVLVESYESLVETATFFAKAPPAKANGAAIVAASGGAAIMAADRAEQHGVPLPQPSGGLHELLISRIPDFGAARNPCDVTGQILNDPESLNVCAGAFLADPQYATLVVPMTYGFAASAERIPIYNRLAAEAGKIVCIAWQTEWLEGPGVREAEGSEHVAIFRSMSALFAAVAAWIARSERRARPAVLIAETPADVVRAARTKLAAATGAMLTEREAKDVLMLYGLPGVPERLTHDADEAVKAANAMGYPVVLKLESPDLPHKTEAGVISLDLRDAQAVRDAYRGIMSKASAISPAPRLNGMLVQKMIGEGIEIVVGARVDPLFGPLVVVGLGGIMVELLQDTVLAPAPVTHEEALGLLGRLKGARLLDGFRGLPSVDRERLAHVICGVSRFAAEHRDAVAELDVNPLICNGADIAAVDALIVRAR